MRQSRTRILSLLLALVMCLSLLPVAALAVEDGDTVTITFKSNYPGGETFEPVSIPKGGTASLPTPADRPGYIFYCWYFAGTQDRDKKDEFDDQSFAVGVSEETAFPSDTTLYAYWVEIHTITFDANGGTVSPVSAKTNVEQQLDIPLPTPVRAGYTFLGWFTGDSYQAGDHETWGGDQVLTAHWKEAELTPVRVNFYPNGGRITEFKGRQIPALDAENSSPYVIDSDTAINQVLGFGWTNTETSGQLASLPTVEREGSTFDGWYILGTGPETNSALDGTLTDFSGLEKFSPSYKFTAEGMGLAAKWSLGGTYTVTFDLNGATGTPPAPQKVEKGKTVNLPVLSAANAKFLGWGYSTDGKTLTEWKADDTVTRDLTLYAMWEIESGDVLRGLTYRFGNNHEAYGYAKGYKIPEARYKLVFGDNTLASQLYAHAGVWGGNCFGMSTTSGMFYVDNDVDTTSFDKSARVPYELSTGDRNSAWNNMTVREFIEAMQISQCGVSMKSGLSSLISAVESFERSGPVVIGMTGPQGGHAVVGYAVERDTSTQSRLMIYDPNYPDQEKYITLYKNGSNYTGWYYYLGKDADGNDMNWGSDYRRCTIAYLPYADYYRLRNNWAKNVPTSRNLMFLNLENAVIQDSDGKTVATVTNGAVSTNRSDVYPMADYGVLLDGTSNTPSGAAVWLPSNEVYTVTTTEKNIEAAMVNVDQSAAVTTSAQSVTFAVNDDHALDYVRVDQTGASYNITLSSTLDRGYEDVQLTGTTASAGISLAQVSGSLYAMGTDSGSALKVDGKNTAVSALSGAMPDIDGLLTGSAQKPAENNPFTDVKAGSYYYDAVLWAVQNGVTSGTSPVTFSPDASCTRGQTVTFLWRAAGSLKAGNSANPFADVRSGAYYYDAVLWAVQNGVTSGTGAAAFSPDATVTRGQTVTFLYRSQGK